jgi:uncharacterized damage-inducible protein DinB
MTTSAQTTARVQAGAALTFDELLRHNEEETGRWHEWFKQNPAALDVAVDMVDMKDVRGVLVHIFAVELLYTERMRGITRQKIALEDFPSDTLESLFSIGAKARAAFRQILDQTSEAQWHEHVVFLSRASGTIGGSRRKLFAHALLHSVRHWAQLATALRAAGYKQDWQHDFIFAKTIE